MVWTILDVVSLNGRTVFLALLRGSRYSVSVRCGGGLGGLGGRGVGSLPVSPSVKLDAASSQKHEFEIRRTDQTTT